MKKILSLVLNLIVAAAVAPVFGQETDVQGRASQIVGIQVLGKASGVAFTRQALYRTDDGGQTWVEAALGKEAPQTIAQVHFTGAKSGWALLSDSAKSTLGIRRTEDGGLSWTAMPVDIEVWELSETDLENARIGVGSVSGEMVLTIPMQTSSNFKGEITYASADGGGTWKFRSRNVELNTADEAKAEQASGGWTLRTDGVCLGAKSGCVQETRLYRGGSEITPPQVLELARVEREAAVRVATPMFQLAPGGSTRISTNKGFDKCTAFSTTQAQTWWNSSPYYNVNIYMSGRNRACPNQPFNGNPAWLDQVTAMGWGLIPTVVGYQSPCTSSSTTAKLSYDAATAETQGRGEADTAVNDAIAIGLTAGSILYYDMERYDPPNPDTLGCEPATRAFLKGWTDRIHELGYISGTYGSPFNAQNHWVNLPAASKMDVVWLANWDNRPTVWFFNSFQSFPTSLWPDHQRIKQYFNVTESWGGVSFNIDRDISDAPVAGVAILRNRNADFDGDGKSDVSVFRPAEGIWYVLSSIDLAFSGAGFGNSSDVIAPGDYDGDGKTDYCVFRPADGVWHMLTKAGNYDRTAVRANRRYSGAGRLQWRRQVRHCRIQALERRLVHREQRQPGDIHVHSVRSDGRQTGPGRL